MVENICNVQEVNVGAAWSHLAELIQRLFSDVSVGLLSL